jgi:exopolysaccharide production protein ExoQ
MRHLVNSSPVNSPPELFVEGAIVEEAIAVAPISRIEKAFTLAALFFHTGALACFIGPDNPLMVFRETAAYLGFAISLGLLLLNYRTIFAVLPRDLLLVLLIGLTLVSPLWSDDPLHIFKNLIPFLRVTIFGLYFALRYPLRDQVQMLAWVFGAAAIASVLLALFLPFYGIMGYGIITNSQQLVHQGTWRGAFIHRNYLSAMMVIGCLAGLFSSHRHDLLRWFAWGLMGLAFFLIIISASKSAPVVLFATLSLIPFFRALRWNGRVAIPFFVITVLILGSVSVWAIANAADLLTALGRDATLTGRTNYWGLMLSKAWERPWLGYGYNGLWVGDWKGEIADVWRFLQDGDEPPHPHNGFLFVWLNIGLVGLSVFVIHWFRTMGRAIRWLQAFPTLEGLVPIAYLCLFIMINLTETMLMQPDLIWVLYISASLSLVAGHEPEVVDGWVEAEEAIAPRQ